MGKHRNRLGLLFLAALMVAASLNAGASHAATAIKPLPPGTSWQWQIDGGTIDTTALDHATGAVKMFDVDMEETPAATITTLHGKGIIVVCYLETGSWESYRSDAGSYPKSTLGNTMGGYPDERYVDIRQISVLRPIIDARLDRAKAKGCDGIEPDIDDSWQENTGFPLTLTNQLTYNTQLIADAHARGMSMGQKNGPVAAFTKGELAAGADWALNEQCNQYSECGPSGGNYAAYIAAGKAVFQVEYRLTVSQFCAKDNAANFDGLRKKASLGVYRVPCRNG